MPLERAADHGRSRHARRRARLLLRRVRRPRVLRLGRRSSPRWVRRRPITFPALSRADARSRRSGPRRRSWSTRHSPFTPEWRNRAVRDDDRRGRVIAGRPIYSVAQWRSISTGPASSRAGANAGASSRSVTPTSPAPSPCTSSRCPRRTSPGRCTWVTPRRSPSRTRSAATGACAGSRWSGVPGTDHAAIATQNVIERQLADEGTTKEALGEPRSSSGSTRGTRSTAASSTSRCGGWGTRATGSDHGSRSTTPMCAPSGSCSRRCSTRARLSRTAHRQLVPALPLRDQRRGDRLAGAHRHALLPEVSGRGRCAHHRRDGAPGDHARRHRASRSRPATPRYSVAGRQARDAPAHLARGADLRGRRGAPEFGTGALKVTPGHDPTDYEIGARHSLPDHQRDRARRHDGRAGVAAVSRHAGRAGENRRWCEALRALGVVEKEEPYTARGGPLRPLRHGARTARQRAVVGAHGVTRGARHRRRRERGDPLPSGALHRRVSPLDAQHPRLVHQPADLARPCDPGVDVRQRSSLRVDRSTGAMRRMWRHHAHQRSRTCSTRGSAAGCGRSPSSDGPSRPPTSRGSTRPTRWSRGATSSSSGWPG